MFNTWIEYSIAAEDECLKALEHMIETGKKEVELNAHVNEMFPFPSRRLCVRRLWVLRLWNIDKFFKHTHMIAKMGSVAALWVLGIMAKTSGIHLITETECYTPIPSHKESA